jgi:hypothetical protein
MNQKEFSGYKKAAEKGFMSQIFVSGVWAQIAMR